MKKLYILMLALLCLTVATCKKDVEPYVFNADIKVTDIKTNMAVIEAINEEEGFDRLEAVVLCSADEKVKEPKQYKMTYEDEAFKANVDGLLQDTKYYYKIIFTGKYNSVETEVSSFETEKIVLPIVTTAEATEVTTTTAVCGGNVSSDGGGTITARGVCWSISKMPTIDNNKTNDGSGTGVFTSNLSNLASQTTYYVRAYATNEEGTAYGEEKSFKTLEEPNQSFTVNGVTFTMIAVEGGTFQMGATSEQGSDADGDEKPVHTVTLSDYYIGETEVTQELWKAVMGSNPSIFSGYPQRPVELVSWNDCQEFITKLNELTGENFRLPTEAEWEYAASGGNKSQGYKYSGSNTIGNVAWYDDNSSSTTHDVKTKQANELGIYDMSGNVYEWCQDWYGSYSSGSQTNPTGPSSGSDRVHRGGSWYFNARSCRVSHRHDYYRYNGQSVRPVLE